MTGAHAKRYSLTLPIAFSIAAHGGALAYIGGYFYEKSTYAMSTQVQGVSLELVPGPAPADAPVAEAPPAPASQPVPVEPKRVLKEVKQIIKPKPILEKPKKDVMTAKKDRAEEEKPQAVPAEIPLGSERASLENPAPANAPRAVGGTGQGGGSPDVRAEPDYLRNPPPVYPRESRREGEEGTVIFSVLISSEGDVKNLTLKKSSTFPRLDASAEAAVRKWRFKPAKLGGMPLESSVDVPVRFVLR